MSTPSSDYGFLRKLEVDITEELTMAESSEPEEEAFEVPIDEVLFDPTDVQRYEVGLRGLLGAVQAVDENAKPAPDGGTPQP